VDNLDSSPSVLYTGQTFHLEETSVFAKWLGSVLDRKAKTKIADRLKRASNGNFGDYRSVRGGVFELRVDYGPGYRVYFFQRGKELVILLCGGDKRTQVADVAHAKRLKAEIEKRDGDKTV
jgi:putative addiction module killer protein